MNFLNLSEYSRVAKEAKIKLFFLDWQDSDDCVVWINLYGTMLFSHDEEKRKMWISRSLLYVRFGEAAQEDERYQDEIGDDFKLLSDFVGGAGKLIGRLCTGQMNSIFSEEKGRYKQGILAGLIFVEALRNNISISKAADRVYFGGVSEYEETFGKYNQKYILDNIWPQYLPSVHLWASFISYLEHGASHIENVEKGRLELFSCPALREKRGQDGVKGLVLLAEEYLFEGLKSRPKRTGSRKTLLDITKMVFVFHHHRKWSSLVAPNSVKLVIPSTKLLHVSNHLSARFFPDSK